MLVGRERFAPGASKEEIVSGWLRPVRAPPLCLGSSGSKRFAAPYPCGASMLACPHLLSGSERSLQHGTNHSTARHRATVTGRRGVRRLGTTGISHRTWPARGVPRAVLPGRTRPCRSLVGALARLLPLPRPHGLL